jgi:hypothetical protein
VELRERRVAQIVRDFMEAYALSQRIGEGLHSGTLDFDGMKRLVGEYVVGESDEESILYRLKEESHALYRFDGARTRTELQAEELFDLAVGALFHEAMKLREGFYLATVYGPRLDRMLTEGVLSGPLAEAFQRVFQDGRRRMFEAQAETASLLRETRDQLRNMLRDMAPSGAVARSLVEDAARTEAVFGLPLEPLLQEIYGSPLAGYRLALQSLIDNGHYAEAAELLARAPAKVVEGCGIPRGLVCGMAYYHAGESAKAVNALAAWVESDAPGAADWRRRAGVALGILAEEYAGEEPSLATRARELLERLKPTSVR